MVAAHDCAPSAATHSCHDFQSDHKRIYPSEIPAEVAGFVPRASESIHQAPSRVITRKRDKD